MALAHHLKRLATPDIIDYNLMRDFATFPTWTTPVNFKNESFLLHHLYINQRRIPRS